MARGSSRRTYTRDGNGRFASTGTTTAKTRPAARRAATRAGNRLNRDNSGRISGIGRNGATVRGGRLKTAKGNARATQTASMRPAGFRSGTIAKGGRGISGPVARSMAAVRRERAGAQGGQATSKVAGAAKPTAPKRTRFPLPAGSIAKPKGLKPGELTERRSQKMKTAIAERRNRLSAGFFFRQRTRGTKKQKSQTRATTQRAAVIYSAQERLRNTGRLTPDVIKRGTPKMAQQAAARAAAAKAAAKPTPRKPTPQGPGPRTKAARPAGTVAKPKGLRPGALAERRGASGRTVYRTRAQAAANQKERNRRLSEFAKSAPGFSREWQRGPQSINRKSIKVNQGNLLTGKTDRATTNTRTSQSSASRIGQSAAAKRTQVRRDRAEARYEALLSERKAITGRGRVRAGALARNSQRMAAVGSAFRVYDMGTGRKGPKRSTGRRTP